MNSPTDNTNILRNLIPINELPASYQLEIVRRGKILKLRKGRYVFKEGTKDNYSFYLLEGELELTSSGQLVQQLKAGADAANHPLSQLQPRQLSARAVAPVQVFRVDRTLLDRLLTNESMFDSGATVVEVSEIQEAEGTDWMTRMLGSELFNHLPAANIQRIFTRMEAIELEAGDVVVKQGAPGDYYFIIEDGHCIVTRETRGGAQPVKVAELRAGDSFGEESLITDTRRNATVTMATSGRLMRLAKRDFEELITKPTLSVVTYSESQSLVAEGARWLDVRFPEEFKKSGIPGSLNVSLNVLRDRTQSLDRDQRYIVYCDTGGRSSAAAFILTQQGFDAMYLAGGLMHSPLAPGRAQQKASSSPAAAAAAPAAAPVGTADSRRARTPATPSRPAPASTASRPRVAPTPKPTSMPSAQRATVTTAASAQSVASAKAAVAAAVPEAVNNEIAKLKQELAQALKEKTQAEQAKAKLEKDLQKAPSEDDVQARLQAEKSRLESEVAQTAQALSSVERERTAAAEQLQREKQALASRMGETERRLAEALAAKEKAENARRLAESNLEDSIRTTKRQLEAQGQRAKSAMSQLDELRNEVERAQTMAQEERKRKEEREIELERLRRETEIRLRAEEEQLRAEADRRGLELERVEQLKREAESLVKREREHLAAESEARMTQLQQLEENLEAKRRETHKEVVSRHQELAEIEAKLRERERQFQRQVEQAVAEERRRLETEMRQQAQHDRQAVEQALRSAEQEAERTVAEYKAAHENILAEEIGKLDDERRQLEAEGDRIQKTLVEAERIKKVAESARRAGERQAARLQSAKPTKRREQAKLGPELLAEIEAANRQLQRAERAHEVAEAARRANEAGLARQRQQEEDVRQQLDWDKDRVISREKLEAIRRQREALERRLSDDD